MSGGAASQRSSCQGSRTAKTLRWIQAQPFPPLWLGVLSATGLMVLGHLLLLFAIAAAMLRRRDEYS